MDTRPQGCEPCSLSGTLHTPVREAISSHSQPCAISTSFQVCRRISWNKVLAGTCPVLLTSACTTHFNSSDEARGFGFYSTAESGEVVPHTLYTLYSPFSSQFREWLLVTIIHERLRQVCTSVSQLERSEGLWDAFFEPCDAQRVREIYYTVLPREAYHSTKVSIHKELV